MKIPLSPRLQACCQLVSPGQRVADIGTDHGYLGIWLLKNNIARSIIASDIATGPLSVARRNAVKFQCADKMEFYLSDGVSNIPKDFDVMICAGMGADTMISILSAAPWLQQNCYRLILQCQSKTPELRKFLSDHGWQISREILVRDGRFLYTVIEAVFSAGKALSPVQLYLSPALLAESAPELPEYYQRICKGLHLAVDSKGCTADPQLVNILQQLENDPDLQWLKEETR